MENRPSLLKPAAVIVLLLAAGSAGLWWLKIHDFNVRLAVDDGVNVLRDAGPWVFFAAFAILPALGMPILAFYLTAGSAFSERLGLGGVLAATSVSLLVNITLSYWLARYALRPWLQELVGRTPYRIPAVAADEHAEITLIVRITPGPPFFVQSYLLGLAEVAFPTYLIVSWVISIAYASGFIVFGDAILHGKGKMAVFGLSAMVAVALIVHVLRKHYGKKRA